MSQLDLTELQPQLGVSKSWTLPVAGSSSGSRCWMVRAFFLEFWDQWWVQYVSGWHPRVFLWSVALSVHQVVHDITLPFGVKEIPDSVCGCALNRQRGRWPRFGYMRRGRTQTVFEVVKDGKWVIFYTVVGFLAVSRQGLLVLRLWKDPWIRYFHNSFKQGSLIDSYTSCPGCKGWCGRRWQPASSFWCQIALSSLTWAISQVCSLCVIQPSTAALQKYFRVLQTKEKVEVGTPRCVRNVRASG